MAGNCDRSTALMVLKNLNDAGYVAYFAGGCVRDMLMGRKSNDYDVATSAEPADVQQLFKKVLMVGAQFGVAMVIHKGQTVEVATFRNDFNYTDGRRPEGVAFSTPQEDAQRRDFTINGMFYDPITDDVIDFVEGQDDLESGIIRTIGNPDDRLSEDYLRMLRAVRFAVRFDFKIESQTKQAIIRHAEKIRQISGERICDELTRMLTGHMPEVAAVMLNELGLAREILPEMFMRDNLWHDAVARLSSANIPSVEGQLGMLLCDLDIENIRKIVRRWGGSNNLKKSLEFLAANKDAWKDVAAYRLCELKKLLANPNSDALRTLWRVREYVETHAKETHEKNEELIASIDPQLISPEPLLDGNDLIDLGVREGKKMGEILQVVYDLQLDEKITTKEQATEHARKMLAGG